MGMAASQARFLELTARKSNVEFQGQQINQQRTTLSSESAAYNQQLLTMDVPTAPSTGSFTKTTYSTTDASGKALTLKSVAANADGTANVIMSYTYSGVGSADANGLFSLDKTSGVYSYKGKDLTATTSADVANLKKAFGGSYDDTASYYKFIRSSSTDSFGNVTNDYGYVPQAAVVDAIGTGVSGYADYKYLKGDQTLTGTTTWSDVTMNYDSTGRLTSIVYNNQEYSTSANTTTDENAYDDAMNKYNYEKEVYNQRMNQINAKLSIIQQHDKNLELKLKDLDTEQNAISTEMDAVKKVISKNVESSFKTFNA